MIALHKGEYTGDIIHSTYIEGSTITNTLYAVNKNNPEWHYHENLHICFVFEGGKAETRHQTSYSKKEGSIFFYHSEEKHRWISPLPVSKSANIEIEQGFLQKYNLTEAAIKNAILSNINAKALILKIQNELLVKGNHNHINLQTLLLELVSHQKQKTYTEQPRWVILLNQLLNDSWNESISLQEIAIQVGAHPVTISKNFRKYFHCNLGEYRRKLKIEKSIDLIKNTQLSLSEIAFHCGFTDQSHFIRNFKELTGFLPKDYRKF
ncbi:AraC family transcriptional regulator [Aquimarina sp. BL5]|uniref:AraC family transcriptional regulator n=1 Tax=Aquimarina sp. BL5 TaxID=1714860 RepID=UPI000E4AEB35|nr:AraC family transcriptional regulator [Aquimarina sp. BL5]AXT50698.1 AraC family transcriptional regulator [Aquimarina sp. BL5]RKN05286.1 helix-turn-helix domain-containing protein [Aquimarina sp. BL5]